MIRRAAPTNIAGLVARFRTHRDWSVCSNRWTSPTFNGAVTPRAGIITAPDGSHWAHNFKASSNSYLDFGAPSIALLKAITVVAWVKIDSLPGAYGCWFSSKPATSGYIRSDGKLALYLSTDTTGPSYDPGTITLSTGRWYHLAFSYDAVVGGAGYVDGVLDGTTSASNNLRTLSNTVRFGVDDGGQYFDGTIDDLRIYNRVLSKGEIIGLRTEAFQPTQDIETIALEGGLVLPASAFDQAQRARRPGSWGPRRGPLTGKAYVEYQPPQPPLPQQPDPYEQRRRALRSPRRGPQTGKAYVEYQPPLPPDPQRPDPYEQRRRRPGGWSPKRGPLTGKGYVELRYGPLNDFIVIDLADLPLTGGDITVNDVAPSDTINVTATDLPLAGGTIAVDDKQFIVATDLPLAGGTVSVDDKQFITATDLPLAGGTVAVDDKQFITATDLPLSGGTVAVDDKQFITATDLPLSGGTVSVDDKQFIVATDLPLNGGAIAVDDKQFFTSTDLPLSGGDITVSDPAPGSDTIGITAADLALFGGELDAIDPVVVPPEVTGAPSGVWRAGRRGGRGSGLVLRRLKKKIDTLEEQLQELGVEPGEATPWVEAFPEVPAIAREDAAPEPDLAARIHAIAAKLEAAREELARMEEEEMAAVLLLLHP